MSGSNGWKEVHVNALRNASQHKLAAPADAELRELVLRLERTGMVHALAKTFPTWRAANTFKDRMNRALKRATLPLTVLRLRVRKNAESSEYVVYAMRGEDFRLADVAEDRVIRAALPAHVSEEMD
jgi:hypothetical protein